MFYMLRQGFKNILLFFLGKENLKYPSNVRVSDNCIDPNSSIVEKPGPDTVRFLTQIQI